MKEPRTRPVSAPSIRVVDSPLGRLTFIGGASPGGTYVLRIRVRESMTVVFGRFGGGKPVHVAAGDHLYVGSALGRAGASCPAGRLACHATRIGGHPPHPILGLMLDEFPRARLCRGDPRPRKPKRAWYNVDHLLDRTDAELVGAYLIQDPERIEPRLGRLLEDDDATVAFEPGLGANDYRGYTFLLRVDAGEEWWEQLPEKLQRLLLAGELEKAHRDLSAGGVPGPERLSNRNIVTLLNMWHERAADVLRRMAGGASFSRANRESEGVYDTCGWSEVASRLCRGRGSILKLAAILGARRDSMLRGREQRRCVAAHASALRSGAVRLMALVARIPPSCPLDRAGNTPEPACVARADAAPPVTFARVEGMLKQCAKFIAKNLRDVPLIREKTGAAPSPGERAKINLELARICTGADVLLRISGKV